MVSIIKEINAIIKSQNFTVTTEKSYEKTSKRFIKKS